MLLEFADPAFDSTYNFARNLPVCFLTFLGLQLFGIFGIAFNYPHWAIHDLVTDSTSAISGAALRPFVLATLTSARLARRYSTSSNTASSTVEIDIVMMSKIVVAMPNTTFKSSASP
jgi:hypothetical protein